MEVNSDWMCVAFPTYPQCYTIDFLTVPAWHIQVVRVYLDLDKNPHDLMAMDYPIHQNPYE